MGLLDQPQAGFAFGIQAQMQQRALGFEQACHRQALSMDSMHEVLRGGSGMHAVHPQGRKVNALRGNALLQSKILALRWENVGRFFHTVPTLQGMRWRAKIEMLCRGLDLTLRA